MKKIQIWRGRDGKNPGLEREELENSEFEEAGMGKFQFWRDRNEEISGLEKQE